MQTIAKLIVATLAGAALISAQPALAGTEQTLYAFQGGNDGATPLGSLVEVGGIFYGTTFAGGGSANCAEGCGTVFSLNPKTGKETVLHAFAGGADGGQPAAGITYLGGVLYGTTSNHPTAGGLGGAGTVFAFDPKTKAYNSYSLPNNGAQGTTPFGGLLALDGLLYGTASGGGPSGSGSVFSFNPAGGNFNLVYGFAGGTADGSQPYGNLLHVGMLLYGTTSGGGATREGAIFAINPTTGAEKLRYSFGVNAGDGGYPEAGMIDVGGTLYGTTSEFGMGSYAFGTIFSFDPASGAENVLTTFTDTTGNANQPRDGLTNVAGVLYTALSAGGTIGSGAIEALPTGGGTVMVTYEFGSNGAADGVAPLGGLIYKKGRLYGTTRSGGDTTSVCSDGCGTVYAVTP